MDPIRSPPGKRASLANRTTNQPTNHKQAGRGLIGPLQRGLHAGKRLIPGWSLYEQSSVEKRFSEYEKWA
ncbi:hypothetical protein GGTG_04722 [Gaeumannomyces tritici R3-111a-1]|uniref:Uncharacterized protein n=1 Tax=Gaeumannomyces tritici (strain R3-111a-1) TaxID=644352 RepID=J3NTX3_GAET3|nr:hypothetical protein GGTG_04722 [Gaeumannomyces tritici R3-111a-1]EJT79638.1 hypothetical protein GGTG_04722 [Gaeumannomyces tritici R3-111a-1]